MISFMGLVRWLLLIFGGALLSFAHPFRYESFQRDSTWWTTLVASAGLIIFLAQASRDPSGWKRFLKGTISGFIYFAIVLLWLINALTIFGGIPLWLSVIIASLLASYCAAFMGVWAWVAGLDVFQEKSAIVRVIGWAALWTALETLRQFLFSGFHWGEIGYHFHYLPFVRESASIWGAHGLTFAWVFCAGCLLHFDHILKDKVQTQVTVFVLSLFIMIGVTAQTSLRWYQPDAKVRVSLLQPNIPQEEKWDPGQIGPITDKLLSLTNAAIKDGAELIVWPETAYPRLISSTQRQLPFSSQIPVVLGAVVREGAINRNSAVLLQNDQILQRFDKIHLVPFGEYVPLQEWLPFKKLVANVGDFKPGATDQALLEIPSKKLNLGPLICYEDTFNKSSQRLASAGANLLVNLTNDAWYGVSSAQAQHAAMSAFQVYQTFLPIVRATNNGMTAMITPFERKDFPNFSEQSAIVDVPYREVPKKTFFVWSYPFMEWIWLIIFAIALAWKKSQTKRIFFR